MKVMKFGGTSVGSVNSILSVKRIVESAAEPVIVVVSALGGITDKLINTSKWFLPVKSRHHCNVRSENC